MNDLKRKLLEDLPEWGISGRPYESRLQHRAAPRSEVLGKPGDQCSLQSSLGGSTRYDQVADLGFSREQLDRAEANNAVISKAVGCREIPSVTVDEDSTSAVSSSRECLRPDRFSWLLRVMSS